MQVAVLCAASGKNASTSEKIPAESVIISQKPPECPKKEANEDYVEEKQKKQQDTKPKSKVSNKKPGKPSNNPFDALSS